jgi:MFS family permease
MTTTAGLAFYNLPVLLDAFVAQRNFPVSIASSGTAIFFVATGVAGVIVGQFVDRVDPRYAIIGGAIMASFALLSVGWITEPWQLFAFYVVFGFAYGACGLIPTTTIVARWFNRRRALAMSISSTGLSLGGVVFTPLSALLILKFGLADAAPWIAAAFFLGVVPVTIWIVRQSPAAMGLKPDGEAAVEGTASRGDGPYIPLREVWSSRFFISVTVGFMLALGAQVGGIAHLFRLANTRVDVETAATAVGLLAISSLIGRLVVGWVLTWVGSRAMALGLILFQTGTLVLLAFAEGRLFMLVAAALFGVNAGSMLMMQPLLLAEAFGVRDYARIYSISQLAGVVGYALGPALAGFLYEASGGYTVAYLAIALGSFIGAIVFLFSGPARQRPQAVL